MEQHLWPLLRLKAVDDEALKALYRAVYVETYVRAADGIEVVLHDWLGNRVKFHRHTFDHAFSESSNYRTSYGVHDKPFSKRRARHILWIKEVLKGEQGTIERRHQTRRNNRNRLVQRRSLIVTEEGYVVVLSKNEKKEWLEFVTAFPTDRAYLDKLRRESALLEIRKPQSSGD